MNTLNRRVHRFLCQFLAVVMAAGPVPSALAQQPPREPGSHGRQGGDTTLLADASAEPPNFDLAYVVPNACVIVAARPAQFFKAPAAAMLPIEVVQAASLKELGLDPLDGEQVVLSAAPYLGGVPTVAAYAKFGHAAALKPGAATRGTEPARINGKTYLKATQPMAPSIYAPDDKSLLITPEPYLQQFVANSGPDHPAPLTAKFAAAAKGDDLLAMVDVEALRPLISLGMAQAVAQIPPEFRSVVEVPNLIQTVELRINVSGHGVSNLVVMANDEAAAKRIVEIFEAAKRDAFAKMADDPQNKRLRESSDPVEQATGKYQERLMNMWKDVFVLDQDGSQIVLFRQDARNFNQLQSTAVIGILVALLLPAVQAAREAARRTQSMNNMKQIMLALHNYVATMGYFPAYANVDGNGKPLLSWRVQMLPFIEQGGLYNQFHFDEPWNSEHNKPLIAKMPEIFRDPSSRFALSDGKSNYLGVKGQGLLFDGSDVGRRLQDITDGTSNSIAIVQVDDSRAAIWTKPDDWEMDAQTPLKGLGGLHAGGIILTGFCDGSVRVISADIDLSVFKHLLTIDGGEADANLP